jgi:hypothetical protein
MGSMAFAAAPMPTVRNLIKWSWREWVLSAQRAKTRIGQILLCRAQEQGYAIVVQIVAARVSFILDQFPELGNALPEDRPYPVLP